MAVLLIGEVTDGALSMDATAKAVAAVAGLGDVTVLCAGASASAAAAEAATIDGVAKVLCAEDAVLGHRLAEPTADLIVSLAGDYEHIAAPATTDARGATPPPPPASFSLKIPRGSPPLADGGRAPYPNVTCAAYPDATRRPGYARTGGSRDGPAPQ